MRIQGRLDMTKLRPPPAYQEYATDTLTNRQFRLLSLPERGLRATMRMECWANGTIPCSAKELALFLNLNPADVQRNLTIGVLSYFEEHDGNLSCPELEGQRERLMTQRAAQASGGKKGGQTTQKKYKDIQVVNEGNLQASLEADPKAKLKVLSRDEENREEESREELSVRNYSMEEHANWLAEFDAADPTDKNEYKKKSRGY
jgi:hypothetical protein